MTTTTPDVFEIDVGTGSKNENEINLVDFYPDPTQPQVPTQAPRFPRLTFRPELDGLRTLAVVPVVLYHFNLSFPGGFAGVDVFFVISGYLITSVILSGLEAETFSFKRFWVRRCRRLFPASTFMLAITLLVANFILLGINYEKMSNQATATQLVGANFFFYVETTSYFYNPLEVPLLHCWSLAVEEQFYTIFPFCVWLVWIGSGRNKAATNVSISFAVTFIASFVASVLVAPGPNSMFGFYLLPCRAWEMIMGSLLVVVESYVNLKSSKLIGTGMAIYVAREISGWAGIGMIISSYFLLDHHVPWPSYPTLLPCIGTILFIASNTPLKNLTSLVNSSNKETSKGETSKGDQDGDTSKEKTSKKATHAALTTHGYLVGLKPLVLIGGASYSIYLWHWPIFVFISYKSTLPDNALGGEMTILGLVASFGAGFASWLTIEPLFRSPPSTKKKSSSAPSAVVSTADKRFLLGVFVVWVAMLLFTTLGASQFGLRSSKTTIDRPISNLSACECCMEKLSHVEEYTTFRASISTVTKDSIIGSKLWSQASSKYSWAGPADSVPFAGPADKPVKIVFIGNSHMQNWAWILSTLAIEYGELEGYKVAFIMRGGEYGMFYPGELKPRFVKTKKGSSLTWDNARLEMLEEWNGGIDGDGIDLIVRADHWGATWYTRNFRDSFDFEYEMSLLAARARRVLYLGDLPILPVGHGNSAGNQIANWAISTYENQPETSQSWNFLQKIREDLDFGENRRSAELRIQVAASKIGETYSGRVDYMEIASTFLIPDGMSDGLNGTYVQILDKCTGGIIYTDYGHVNQDANYWLEGRFREGIFNQMMCTAGESGRKPALSCTA